MSAVLLPTLRVLTLDEILDRSMIDGAPIETDVAALMREKLDERDQELEQAYLAITLLLEHAPEDVELPRGVALRVADYRWGAA